MNRKHEKYDQLIARCKSLPPTPTAVALLVAKARREHAGQAIG